MNTVEFRPKKAENIEEKCADIRSRIKLIEEFLVSVLDDEQFKGEAEPLDGPNIPKDKLSNMKDNLTLAFRHLEDARMRLGKVMQAYNGGVSILDKK